MEAGRRNWRLSLGSFCEQPVGAVERVGGTSRCGTNSRAHLASSRQLRRHRLHGRGAGSQRARGGAPTATSPLVGSWHRLWRHGRCARWWCGEWLGGVGHAWYSWTHDRPAGDRGGHSQRVFRGQWECGGSPSFTRVGTEESEAWRLCLDTAKQLHLVLEVLEHAPDWCVGGCSACQQPSPCRRLWALPTSPTCSRRGHRKAGLRGSRSVLA